MIKPFAIVILFLVSSCDVHDDRLRIVNQLDKVICFDYEVDTILDVPSINKKDYFIGKRMEPGDTTRVLWEGMRTGWIYYVSKGQDSTLSIFVFDYEEVLKNDWDSLRTKRKYKRLDYTLNKLNKINWTVIVE